MTRYRYPLARRQAYQDARDAWLRRIPALCDTYSIPRPDQATLNQAAHVLSASYKRRGHLTRAARDLLQVLAVKVMDDRIAETARVHNATDATS